MSRPGSWQELMRRWHISKNGCQLCGEYHYGPVVKDEVWRKIMPTPKGLLCLPCMEAKLGRKIEEKDLFLLRGKPLPWNTMRKEFFMEGRNGSST